VCPLRLHAAHRPRSSRAWVARALRHARVPSVTLASFAPPSRSLGTWAFQRAIRRRRRRRRRCARRVRAGTSRSSRHAQRTVPAVLRAQSGPVGRRPPTGGPLAAACEAAAAQDARGPAGVMVSAASRSRRYHIVTVASQRRTGFDGGSRPGGRPSQSARRPVRKNSLYNRPVRTLVDKAPCVTPSPPAPSSQSSIPVALVPARQATGIPRRVDIRSSSVAEIEFSATGVQDQQRIFNFTYPRRGSLL
jgi:hypothetical protein